jgi:hypothetical protein
VGDALLVQQRERLLASPAGSSGPSVLNFIANFDSGKPLDTEIFEQERRLAAYKEIGRLTLAVEEESGASRVVYSVVTGNKKNIISGG